MVVPAALDSGELQQAGRRDTTRSFGMRSKACIDWAASAVTPARQSLEWTNADGRANVHQPPLLPRCGYRRARVRAAPAAPSFAEG